MSPLNINCGLVAQFPWKSKMGSICERRSPRIRCISQEHYLWVQRNKFEILKLAKMVGCHPEDIDGFLFELSLENFSRQLNPKGCGWDACNVPLCYPHICGRYMSIFDHRGNLRCPNHSEGLYKLLSLLLDFLNGDSPEGQRDSPTYKVRPDGHPANRHSKSVKVLRPDSESSDDESLPPIKWSLTNTRVPRTRESIHHESQPVQEQKPDLESQEDLGKKKQNKKFGRQTVFLNDELALAFAKPNDIVEYLMKILGRHRSRDSYIGPVGDLRTKRIRILIRNLVKRKGTHITNHDLRQALYKVDLEWKSTAKADYMREMKTAKEISNLYNVIVQRPSQEPIPPVLGEVWDSYPKIPSGSRLPRKYLADQVPVLFHEPYDPEKNWTWQRRHPKQSRLNSQNKISQSRIKRYIRTSVKSQIRRVEDQYSIHSTISDNSKSANRESLEPQFGGVKK
ncbi:uncharacterized protein LOC108040934 [Drosophila rhopaloa]|uniref:Uncharacterized protein n=1 Tax=Drosophila rhopaloa TaxID=1041015 RepID=A0ABM5J982_DRORH|nr:uncharacterized protein LOC108040934 [Drosophila rhopaloa]